MTDQPASGPEQPKRPDLKANPGEKTASPDAKKTKPKRKGRVLPWIVVILLIAVFAAGVVLAPRIVDSLPPWLKARVETDQPAPVAETSRPDTQPPVPMVDDTVTDEEDGTVAEAGDENWLGMQTESSEPEVPELDTDIDPRDELPPQSEMMTGDLPEIPPTEAERAPSGVEAPPPLDTGRLAALERKLDRLQESLERNDDRPAVQDFASDLSLLSQRVGQLFDEMVKQVGRLQALEEDLNAPEEDITQPLTILAVSRLHQAVEQGSSYVGALSGVRRLADAQSLPQPARDAIDTLQAHAQQGVASMQALRDAFEGDIDAILAADDLPPDASWWDRTVASIKGAVTLRPTGEVKGDDTAAIVARAEAALARGDLDEALAELQALPSQPALAASDWLQKAQTRQAVMKAVATLENTLLESGTGTAMPSGMP
jgi:hypothetical protein